MWKQWVDVSYISCISLHFFNLKGLKKRGVTTSLLYYLPEAQAQFSPHKQGLQEQFGLSLVSLIVVFMIFCFYVI
jgi:hypothetical protein